MLEFLKDVFLHKDSFVGYVRAGLIGLGSAQLGGLIPDGVPRWVGVAALMGAGLLRAGDKNKPS